MTNKEMNDFFENFVFDDRFFEVRIIGTDEGTISGSFNDADQLLRSIKKYDGKYNIFFTMNPIDQDIDSKRINHFVANVRHTTADKDILRRHWILIDLDPVRPAGVSSTDGELEKAKRMAKKVENFLYSRKFPQPVKCMSGNGIHLLYPVDMENTQENTSLIRKFLRKLDERFSDEDVKVDTSTYNASRITKLYGTIACKGEPTKERPHRKSYIISLPDERGNVTAKMLKKVISVKVPKGRDKAVTIERRNESETRCKIFKCNVPGFCETHGIEISREKPIGDGICYVLKTCPWNPDHRDRSAYIIQFSNGKIVAGCHHDSCSEENWQTLIQKFPDMNISVEPCRGKIPEKTDHMSISEIILEEIRQAGHRFYHNKNGEVYVSVPLENGHAEYMTIQSNRYKQCLIKMHMQNYSKPINKDSLKPAIEVLEAETAFSDMVIEPVIRCKYDNNKLYYYLADREQTVLCIDESGIHLLADNSIPFLRTPNMLEQVMPMDRKAEKGKKKPSFRVIARKYWKFQSEDDLLLHNVLLITRFISGIPSPILYYKGDRGSAKTTSMRLDKMLVDPSITDLTALPKNVNDVVSILAGQYMVSFDNVEGSISADLSNLLCICCSCGYHSKRKLYSDNDTVDVKLDTRLSFSGITTITEREDFLDRCICLTVQRIPPSKRRTMDEILKEFKKDLPYLLHKALMIISKAIPVYRNLDLKELPRMADFAKWGYAIAEVMKYGGDRFLEVYKRNQEEMLDVMLEEDPVLSVLVSYIEEIGSFSGSMTELCAELTKCAKGMDINTQSGWIKTVNSLSTHLFRSKSVLETYGIFIDRGKSNGKRYIRIWKDNGVKE